jgi:FKBP-type peptidyl-prolyl cis-trans isomerase SlyD
MLIQAPCVVSLSWTLTTAQNETIAELAEPAEFFYGGLDLLPKIEDALAGHAAGDELHLHLEPEHAYGEYLPELVCFEDRALFAAHVEPGMAYEGLPPGAATPGMPAERIYTVTEVYPSHVVLDGNHPLAGMALRLHLRVRGVRAASVDELDARSLGASVLQVLPALTPHPPAH